MATIVKKCWNIVYWNVGIFWFQIVIEKVLIVFSHNIKYSKYWIKCMCIINFICENSLFKIVPFQGLLPKNKCVVIALSFITYKGLPP